MQIKEAHIYGFYKWVDQTFVFSDQMQCIYGLNESGKSSLQKFLLFILFGSDPRYRKQAYPKSSSKMGGRLVVENEENGRFIIERRDELANGAAVCYLADGTTREENWLQEQLQYFNESVYSSVFSFTAADLHEHAEQTENELATMILNIGLSGRYQIERVEKELTKKMGDLFKATGKIPDINKQLTEIKETENEFQLAKNNENEYHMLKNTEMDTSTKLSNFESKVTSLRQSSALVSKKIQVLPVFMRYSNNGLNLEALDEIDEQWLVYEERFKVISNEILRIQGEKNVFQQECAELSEQIQRKSDESLSDANYDLLMEHVREIPTIKEQEKIELQNSERIDKLNGEVYATLHNLQISINPEQLAMYEFPFYLRQSWDRLRVKTEQVGVEISQLEMKDEKLRSELAELDEQCNLLRDRIVPSEDTDYIKQRIDQFEEQIDQFVDTEEDSSTQINRKVLTRKKQAKQFRNATIVLALILLIAGFLIYKPLILFAIISVAIGLFYKRGIDGQTTEFSQYLQAYASERSPLTRSEEADYQELRTQVQKNEQNVQELERLERENDKQSDACIYNDEELTRFRDRSQKLIEERHRYEEKYPFLKGIDLSFWIELLIELTALQEKVRTIENLKKQKLEAKTFVDDFMERLASVPILGQVVEKGTNRLLALHKLEQLAEEEKRKRNEFEQIQARYKNRSEDLAESIEVLRPFEDEQTTMMARLTITESSQAYEQFDLALRKSQLLKEHKALEIELDRQFERSEWLAYKAQKESEVVLENKANQFTQQISTLEKEIQIIQESLVKIRYQIEQIEQQADVSKLNQRLHLQKEQLREDFMKWSIYRYAQDTIKKTQKDFQDTYLESVLKQATYYFSEITEGAYKQILTSDRSKEFIAVSETDIHYELKELSKGTLDLFYICLRLATSEVVALNVSLPFMIDDAFVHLDDVRYKRAMKLIKSISKKRQMFFFTCHERHLELFEEDETLVLI